ncbi:MAG: tetratricopeptide repeat protein [Candidatus Eisenbacteria bacterium]|nr:tetratricopeptide repeat protein [Candidatus Eisenbacteria bacterium]
MLTRGDKARRRRASAPPGAWPTLAVLSLLVLCALPLCAQEATPERLDPSSATTLFREANAAYADGRYREAAETYRAIVEGGVRNADVQYNLGNALWKSGEVGPAVLAYERALRLDPGHRDALANLEFVRENLVDRQTAAVEGPLGETVERAYRSIDLETVAVLASLLYVLAAAAVVIGLVRGAFPPYLVRFAVVAAVLLVAAASFAFYRSSSDDRGRRAIIMVREVGVRTGPGRDFVLEFRLHEGTRVVVRETRDDWSRIAITGTDLAGWLPADSVEGI